MFIIKPASAFFLTDSSMWLIGKRPWERLREGTSHVAHKEKDHGIGLERAHPMVCIITGRIVYQPFSRLRLRVEWHSVDKDPLCENHMAFWFIEKRKRFVRLTFLSLQVSVSSRRGYRGDTEGYVSFSYEGDSRRRVSHPHRLSPYLCPRTSYRSCSRVVSQSSSPRRA